MKGLALLRPGLADQEGVDQLFSDPAETAGFDGHSQLAELAVGQLVKELKLLGIELHDNGIGDIVDGTSGGNLHDELQKKL